MPQLKEDCVFRRASADCLGRWLQQHLLLLFFKPAYRHGGHQNCRVPTELQADQRKRGSSRGGADTPSCSGCSESNQIAHVILTIRGAEAHQSTIADDDSLDWQELAPQLAKQPRQVDLTRGTTDRDAPEFLGETVVIPTGSYRQVRVRLVPSPAATGDQLLAENACGSAGFNCVVMSDGRVQPLLLDAAALELRITSKSIVGGFFVIPPESESNLRIVLTPVWLWTSSAAEGVRFLPALRGDARPERQSSVEVPVWRETVRMPAPF